MKVNVFKKHLIQAIVFLVLSFSQSCKKDKLITASCFDGIKNQDETKIDCGGVCISCKDLSGKVKTIKYHKLPNVSYIDNFFYNTDGKIAFKISYDTLLMNYSAGIGIRTLQGYPNDTIFLNVNGMIISGNNGRSIYKYDNDGYLSTYIWDGDTTYLFYADENLMLETTGSDSIFHTYYSEIDNRNIRFRDLGIKYHGDYYGKKSKNLRKTTVYNNGLQLNFTYTFDSIGRVVYESVGASGARYNYY